MNNETLALEYTKLLGCLDTSLLDPAHHESQLAVGLSGVFLTSVSDEYRYAKNKIMVIGRETRGWNVLKGEPFVSVADYVQKSMTIHRKHLESQQDAKNAKGCAFHNFVRNISGKCGSEGIVYSNLFCFDYRESIPSKYGHFDVIKDLSKALLEVQIKVLAPSIIIFANGLEGYSVAARREYFPIKGENKVCFNSKDYVAEGISNKSLWQFDLYNSIRSYRIHHPSSPTKEARRAREFLITHLLPEK